MNCLPVTPQFYKTTSHSPKIRKSPCLVGHALACPSLVGHALACPSSARSRPARSGTIHVVRSSVSYPKQGLSHGKIAQHFFHGGVWIEPAPKRQVLRPAER